MTTSRGTGWLIATKFRPPAPCDWEIERSGLLDELCRERVPLLVVTGPAGYGKTTLLAQYHQALRARGATTAWLTLDEEQRDELDLTAHLLAALAQGSPPLLSMSRIDDWLAAGGIKNLLGRIIAALDESHGPISLLVDDFHKAESEAAVRLFDSLLARLPERAQVVIAARGQPALRLAAFATSGRLRVLSAPELGFTRAEVAEYLERSGLEGDAARLAVASEGWPAGLQLLRLIGAGTRSRQLDPARLSGRQIDVAAYLAEEVLRDLEPQLREFLLQTSVLDRIDGDVANALTGREDGWRRLEDLHRRNLFLVALDSEGMWYRYHHIFREFLREQLRRSAPGLSSQLHARAAEWFAGRNLAREAIRHAVDAESIALLERIVRDLGGWRLSLYAGSSIWSALAQLPTRVLFENPHLALGRCYALMQRGRTREARALFEEIAPRAQSAGVELDIAAVDLLLSAYEDRPWSIERLDEFERRLRAAPESEWPLLISVLDMLAWSQYWAGNFDRAIAAADACLAQCRIARAHFIDFYATLARALALLARGDRRLAYEEFAAAERAASEIFGVGSDQAIAARVFRAEIALDALDLETARRLAPDADRINSQGDAWVDLCISATSVRATLARFEHDAAAADEVLKTALEGPLAARLPRFANMLHILRVRNALAAGDLASARAIGDSAAVQAAVAKACESGDWRLALPGSLAQLRVHAASGDPRVGDLRARARRLIDAFPVPRYRFELELFEWSTSVADTASVAATTEQIDRARSQGLALVAAELGLTSERTLPNEALGSARLSPREFETLRLLREGLTGKEIAARLGISVSTALGYKKSLYRKLRVHRRSQAIAKAFPGR